MDPFHVVRLAGNALDECRRRVQVATCGHRGRKTDPLYRARRTLHTGADLLTDKQKTRLTTLFTVDAHVESEVPQFEWTPEIAGRCPAGRMSTCRERVGRSHRSSRWRLLGG